MNSENNRKHIEQGARTRLLEAGVKLFSKKGYANTSVREIVELAGVSKPILYYYFKSKEGMFHSIMDYALGQQEHMLEKALKRRGSVLDRLTYLYRIMYRVVMEDRNLFKLIHNLIFGPHQGEGLEGIEQYHRRIADAIKTIYLDGLSRGEVKDASPDEVAFLILGVLDFCVHLDYVHPELFDQKRPERLLRLAFFGLNGIHNPLKEEV